MPWRHQGEIKVPDLKVSAGKGSLRILYVLYVFLDACHVLMGGDVAIWVPT